MSLGLELVVFAGVVAGVAVLGIGLGMLVARMIQRMTDASDASDTADAADPADTADEGPGGDAADD